MIESTPEPASAPEPVSSWPLRIAPGRASSVAELGLVASMRICVDAVRTGSVLPTLSTEKYLIV